MQILLRALVAILLPGLGLAMAETAAAADMERQGSRLRMVGALDGSGLAAFTEQLASGDVRTVVFEDSRGGSAEVAEDYARAIRSADVNTEVLGLCSAACAYAFLAGKTHRFGRGPQLNSLLIPLSARPAASDLMRWGAAVQAPGEAHARPMSLSTSNSAGATTAASDSAELVPSRIKEVWRPDQGLLFTATPTLFGRVYSTYYCDGTQSRDLSKCEVLPDADPYRLGILN